MPNKPPAYPAVLTQADWNKQKGIFAKLFKEDTGLGRHLAQLEKNYKAIQWQLWYPWEKRTLGAVETQAELDLRLKLAAQKQSQLNNFREELKDVENICDGIGAKWAKSKVVPASAVKHVSVKIPAALGNLEQAVAQVSTTSSDLQSFRKTLRAT
jgi:hypothetical protein